MFPLSRCLQFRSPLYIVSDWISPLTYAVCPHLNFVLKKASQKFVGLQYPQLPTFKQSTTGVSSSSQWGSELQTLIVRVTLSVQIYCINQCCKSKHPKVVATGSFFLHSITFPSNSYATFSIVSGNNCTMGV